jgi:opacity protein-like surface antigen
MEENLHNDKLEDFLRKSLDGHSEDPPGDLWSKIAANLEPPVAELPTDAPQQLTPRLRVLRNWWSVAAAAAVVIGLLMGQHLYFSSKISQLNKALEQNATQLKQMEQQRLVEAQQRSQETTLTIESAAQAGVSNQGTAATGDTKATTEQQINRQQTGAVANTGTVSPKAEKPRNEAEGTVQPSSVADNKNGVAVANETVANQDNTAKTALTTPAEEFATAKQADMPQVWGRKLNPIDFTAPKAPLASSIIPAAKQMGTRFSVGLQAMPMVTKSKIQRIKEDDRDQHGWPQEDKHKSFSPDSEKSYKSWMTGVVAETNLTPRLRIGTGLNYRTINSDATHTLCLDFKDRGPGRPGQPASQHEHDFEYTLNTSAGTVEMTVRAESDDPASAIPDMEKVEATIKTSEHLAFAAVPFYANYSFGNGRLKVLAKAGMVLNFLLDSDFSIDKITSQNNRFRFDRQKPQKGSPADLQSMSASYMVGLGLEYNLSKSLSLRMEPTVMGSLTSLHNNPFIESSEFSAGLNMGVMYSF